jgi:hypothetical protein
VIIWSFAIDGMRDMDTFERLHRKNVEDKIGFKVKLVVPMQRMVQDICLANGLSFDTIVRKTGHLPNGHCKRDKEH